MNDKTYQVRMICWNCGYRQMEKFPFGKAIPTLGSDLPTCNYCGAAPVFRDKEYAPS